jgi:dihydrofolate reductase
MKVSIIVAVAENGVIGKNNKLIWRLSDDLKNFKRITTGHFIIMGRKTYESIGKPLPNRTNLILSRNKNFNAEGCIVLDSLDKALTYSYKHRQDEVFLIGGAQLYHAVIDKADKLYLTRVHAKPDGDAFFPEIDYSKWMEISHNTVNKNEKNEFDFEIIELERKSEEQN